MYFFDDEIDKNQPTKEEKELLKKKLLKKADDLYDTAKTHYDDEEFAEAEKLFYEAAEIYESIKENYCRNNCYDYAKLCSNELEAIELYEHGIMCLNTKAYRYAIWDFEKAEYLTKSVSFSNKCKDKISECNYMLD